MKKKIFSIILIFVILLLCNVTVAKAATTEELIEYASKEFDINGKTVSLKAGDKVKVERYLKQNPVTEAQADQIISKIDEGIALLRKENVTDPTKLSKAKKEEILSIGQQAASTIGLKLTSTKDGVISIYDESGKKIDEATTSDALVQTGNDTNYSYVVYTIAGIAIVAIAGFIVYTKKGKLKVEE